MPVLNAGDPRPVAVYSWYAPTGQLLYVGSSIDPDRRWGQIRKAEEWPRFASRRTVTWYPDVTQALAAELFAIRTEGPLLNINGLRRGRPMVSEHWRELELGDGEVVTLARFGGAQQWFVGEDAILAEMERIDEAKAKTRELDARLAT